MHQLQRFNHRVVDARFINNKEGGLVSAFPF